jgi:hypothetical protein
VNISDLLVHDASNTTGDNAQPEADLMPRVGTSSYNSEPLQRRSGSSIAISVGSTPEVGRRLVGGSEILPSGLQTLHERTFNERLSKEPPFSTVNQGFGYLEPKPLLSDGTSIPELERQLKTLRGYSTDLLELSLVESHAKVQERIALLQTRIEQRREEKSRAVFSSLQENFPDIAEMAKNEARGLGLINDAPS